MSFQVSTQHFDGMFNADNVEGYISIMIFLLVPGSVKGDQNTTLMFDIKKKTMKEVSDNDQMTFGFSDDIDADLTHWSENITAPPYYPYSYYIRLDRQVPADEINNMDLDIMPGFRLTWNYNRYVELLSKYSNEKNTEQFVRYIF